MTSLSGAIYVRAFSSLSEQEILALAISLEEEDHRVFVEYAHAVAENYPATAKVFLEIAEQESENRRRLIDLYRERFGEHIPLIRPRDIRGFVKHEPIWMVRPLGLDKVRRQVEARIYETRRFYERAQERANDAGTRQLLGDLVAAEVRQESVARQLGDEHLTADARAAEAEVQRRMFVLQIVQPGLAGLMDGSVSTLAPLFAAAFATMSTWQTFLIGMAASVGAGISMGFAEALSDDGSLTGRGHPLLRGTVTGVMTGVGGIGHTLPFLIDDFRIATTLSIVIVVIELWVIAWIRSRYMDTKFLRAAFEIVVGGLIVFGAGILIGNA
jgi:rubrerythrin